MRFGVKSWLWLAVAAVGVLIFILATSGSLFAAPTPASDIGLMAVTMVLLALGVVGAFAAAHE